MPRGRRCYPGGTPFHVLNRGNNRQTLFDTPGDYEAFIRVVKETLLIVSLRILAYCLMPNHWHFVLWPQVDRELSHFMHQLTTTHVRRWHKAHHSEGTGHVYQGPFKSFPVEDDDDFFTVCRYVERNPVRAGLVQRAEDWMWGSTWAHLHQDDRLALPLSPWPVLRPEDWLTRVNEPLTGPELEAMRRCSERGQPFGSRDWLKMTADKLGLQYTLCDRGRPRKPN